MNVWKVGFAQREKQSALGMKRYEEQKNDVQSRQMCRARREALSAAEENLNAMKDRIPSDLMIRKNVCDENSKQAKLIVGMYLYQEETVCQNEFQKFG